jgi:hypothetical protein
MPQCCVRRGMGIYGMVPTNPPFVATRSKILPSEWGKRPSRPTGDRSGDSDAAAARSEPAAANPLRIQGAEAPDPLGAVHRPRTA